MTNSKQTKRHKTKHVPFAQVVRGFVSRVQIILPSIRNRLWNLYPGFHPIYHKRRHIFHFTRGPRHTSLNNSYANKIQWTIKLRIKIYVKSTLRSNLLRRLLDSRFTVIWRAKAHNFSGPLVWCSSSLFRCSGHYFDFVLMLFSWCFAAVFQDTVLVFLGYCFGCLFWRLKVWFFVHCFGDLKCSFLVTG